MVKAMLLPLEGLPLHNPLSSLDFTGIDDMLKTPFFLQYLD
jgi:hypothetical protein